MSEIDYKRTYYCLKKWIEEIKEDPAIKRPKGWEWLINTCEAEIFNGEYLSDEEYNDMITIQYDDRLDNGKIPHNFR